MKLVMSGHVVIQCGVLEDPLLALGGVVGAWSPPSGAHTSFSVALAGFLRQHVPFWVAAEAINAGFFKTLIPFFVDTTSIDVLLFFFLATMFLGMPCNVEAITVRADVSRQQTIYTCKRSAATTVFTTYKRATATTIYNIQAGNRYYRIHHLQAGTRYY